MSTPIKVMVVILCIAVMSFVVYAIMNDGDPPVTIPTTQRSATTTAAKLQPPSTPDLSPLKASLQPE
jgi:hypothetical protein